MPDIENVSESDVQALLAYLADLIDRHQIVRMKNDAIVFGTRKGKVPASVARTIIDQQRDRDAEAEAMNELRKLFRSLNLDFNNGPPALRSPAQAGLSGIPIVALAAITGGALTLTTLFTYLTEREERIQRELGGGGSLLDMIGLSGNSLTLLKIGGLAAAAWFGYQWWQEYQEEKDNENSDDE